MLVKRYHVKDMQQAMDTVIKELGSEAVILSSKKVRQKGLVNFFKKPVLEVMVAYDPLQVPSTKKYMSYSKNQVKDKDIEEPDYDRYEKSDDSVPQTDLTNEKLADLDTKLSSLDHLLNNFVDRFSYVKRDITYDFSPGVEELFAKLIENQVREELAHSIAKETDAILRRQQDSTAMEIMEHLVIEKLGITEPIQPKKFKQMVILFIGSTGVGKTTSLVKLAAEFTVRQKKKVGIINTDTYRIAAQEQLQAYADILDIPLSVVYQLSELREALETLEDREVIFIDTAGKRPGDEQHKDDIMKIIDIANPEEILLCVSAATNFASVKEVIDTYDFIEKYKIIVTKTDETRYKGTLLNACWYAQKSLAYITTGQSVPDDIENIDALSIAGQLLRQ